MKTAIAKHLLRGVALAAVAAVSGPVEVPAQGMPPMLVATDTVRMLEFNEQLTLIGRTEARATSSIVSEVDGAVDSIVTGEGVWVTRGTVLVALDGERVRLDLQSRTADLKQAEAQLQLARSHRKRTEELFARELVRQITLDSAEAWITSAEAQVMRAEALRDRAAIDYESCRIKAPYSGYTLRRHLDAGEWVSVGDPVYDMVDLSELTVVVDLPERKFGHLEIGSSVFIIASGDEQEPLTGRVTGFAPNASGETHTYPVIIKVDNREGRLGGGALVRATLSMKERFSSLAVPKDAVVRQGMQSLVYTINEGLAAPIPVMTSASSGSMVAVSGDGLQVGMPIVVRGNERIFPGSPVRTEESTAPAAPPADGASSSP
jgi:RND family efflux transporter MFP subunit